LEYALYFFSFFIKLMVANCISTACIYIWPFGACDKGIGLCHFKRWVLRWSFDCYFRRMRAYAHQSHQSWKQNWPSKLESYVYTEISCFVM
jgi:hypothetical protein